MKWIAISGSWRKSSPELERDVREAVRDIIRRGDGIVTGGALGVDYIAAEEVLRQNPEADKLKIIIPTPLQIYAAHYRKRAHEGVITTEQAESLIRLLTTVKQRSEQSLIEMQHSVLDQTTYYDRNSKVVEHADELLAFQANHSLGVQDTIDKAHARGLTVSLKEYNIDT